MTTSASQQIATATTTRPGLVRRLADLATPRGARRVRDTTARRRTMDRIIAELNRGA